MSRTLKQMMDLSGRVGVVTGGGGHIGSEAALALAELGADVAVVDVNGPRATATAENITRDFDVRAVAMEVDLSNEKAVRALPDKIVGALGRLDILVNNAAFVGTSKLKGWAVPFEEQELDAWRAALEVNLTAVFALVQSATPSLRESGNGSVINVGSIYGLLGPDFRLYEGTEMGNPAAYGASKGGLLQLTRWLSTALAPNVRVNAITPGGVWRNQPDTFVARYIENTPLGRMASEEDMKGAVAFLASDLSAYVTGENLIVDGGWSAW